MSDNGLVKSADLKVYVKRDEFGDLVSGVTIRADQIELEGLVTANGYFKVLTDGSIETRNANVSGIVKADKGKIAASPSSPAACIGRAAIISVTIPGV